MEKQECISWLIFHFIWKTYILNWNSGRKSWIVAYQLQYWITLLREKTTLALPIFSELLRNNRVIVILPNLQAYFDKRRYFPILMFTFARDFFHTMSFHIMSITCIWFLLKNLNLGCQCRLNQGYQGYRCVILRKPSLYDIAYLQFAHPPYPHIPSSTPTPLSGHACVSFTNRLSSCMYLPPETTCLLPNLLLNPSARNRCLSNWG